MRTDFPEALDFLFKPARYKVAYGGRGAGKSWAFADALLIEARRRPLRILCAREIQKSVKESVHQLLKDRIRVLGFTSFYAVMQDEIRGLNGSIFTFAGLRHNVENIKSKEGLDIVWVEEAVHVSRNSWETLIPTIRKDGSEIWVSFNPDIEADETYQRFVVRRPPNAIVRSVNFVDNPWFPPVLRQEMEHIRETDPDAYLNVWEGKPRQWLDGAIYANELRRATSEGRIGRVPHVSGKPVGTYWDLGEADMTAIWFIQRIGLEWRVINYYENSGHKLEHYLKELQSRPYVYGTHHLPHDAEMELLGSPKSIARQARDMGFAVKIVPKASVANGINAGRTIFDQCWFDEENCREGLNCLRHYQFKVDPETKQRSREPLHNWASHGADAWRYFAVSAKEGDKPKKVEPPRGRFEREAASVGWMG